MDKDMMRFNFLKNPEKTANIKSKMENKMPFEIKWLFGWNSEIGLIGVSKRETKSDLLQMFFVSEHVGIILQYNTALKSKTMETITGHRNFISCSDVESDGRHFVTVDKGNGSMLVVWDSLRRSPVFTVLSPSNTGIAIVQFSVDSRYLITVSAVCKYADQQTISVWDWMSGAEEPTCSKTLDNSFGPVLHLTCSHDNPKFYCFTTEKLIFFMTILQIQEKVTELIINIPNKWPKKILKYNFTQSAYVTNFRTVVSASTTGSLIVWDDIDYYALPLKKTQITNDKHFKQRIQVQKHCITTVICQNGYIITGDTNGAVYFYDKTLKGVYYLRELVGGGSITAIAMVHHNVEGEKVTDEFAFKRSGENVSVYEALRRVNFEYIHPIGLVLDDGPKFQCEPFFISTKNHKIYHVDVTENSCTVFEKFDVELVTALDVHPIESTLILGNAVGELRVYNYVSKELIVSSTKTNGKAVNGGDQVTCIKYSPNGVHLCYGCADGSFKFMNPCNLQPEANTAYKWNDSPVRLITFNKSSKYVVYTDNLFGIYVYGVIMSQKVTSVKYYYCYQMHAGIVRGISITEGTTVLKIYSVGADQRIVIAEIDQTTIEDGEHPKLVKTMTTEPQNEPQCMMNSTVTKSAVNSIIISGSDLQLTVWDDDRCVQTTMGVNLGNPIKIMKESPVQNDYVLFCTDVDIGMLRQPLDGNPYKSAAVLGSTTKMIDIGISHDGKFAFSISENSSSMIMWSINKSYLDELEEKGGMGLKAYGHLLEGGENGPEIERLKEYFYTVQLVNSENPELVVLKEHVDVCEISSLMRAMGYFHSEKELSNMLYEMKARKVNDDNGRPTTLVTFEELVVLYLNYRPQIQIKFNQIRRAFDAITLNAEVKNKTLTRKAFVHAMQNMGEKISPRELEIIFRTLLKTTNDNIMSLGSGGNSSMDHTALPLTFTFEEVMEDLFGFQGTK